MPQSNSHWNIENTRTRQRSTTRERISTEESLARRRARYQRRRAQPSNVSAENENGGVQQFRTDGLNNAINEERILNVVSVHRGTITNEQRASYLATRRTNFPRTRQNNNLVDVSSEGARSTNNSQGPEIQYTDEETGIAQRQPRHTFSIRPINFTATRSSHEQGNTSTNEPQHGQFGREQTNMRTHNSRIQNMPVDLFRRNSRPQRYHNLARNFHESNGYTRLVLSSPKICTHCRAKKFHGETSQLCCRNGTISLDQIPAPIELRQLFTFQNVEGRHFRQYIRAYNHVLSFTSLGVHIDENLVYGRQGVYTFRAHGNMYHRIGSLIPSSNQKPRYLQMWIVDTEHEVDNRLLENKELDRNILIKLQGILDQYNPFVRVFRQLGQRPDIPQCRLIIKQQQLGHHQYSLPTTSQVAAVIVDTDGIENLSNRDIIIKAQDGRLINIQDIVGYYDPLQYPLLLPYGTYGWDINTRTTGGRRLTCRDFCAYNFQIRENDPSLILLGGRLLQQYVVDNYVKIETHKLRWIRQHQHTIRSELYQGLQDCLDGRENNAGNVGHRVVLPSSFTGSPRDMYQRYQNAMALVQTYGKPDLMITMTCNPNWTEIRNELHIGQTPQDRPDLITRIFHVKFDEFKKDIVERGVLGKVHAYTYVIEFQKRGLPHVHLLVIFENRDKLRTLEDFDQVVRAEIPCKEEEPALYEAVLKHMIHGPCGAHNAKSPCMKDGKCKKNFPKLFVQSTSRGKDSYPLYKRREGHPVPLNNTSNVMVDNGWVVPYNPWLLLKYDCHINVEVCGGIKGVKYIYKYIHKGPDRAALELCSGQNHDEIQQFVDGRWISAPEAFWRIFEFVMSRMYPSVLRLQIHLPNNQTIRFDARENVRDILQDEQNSKTMLTEFFTMNCDPGLVGNYLYKEFPQYYRWVQSQNKWVKRTSNNKVIGRIYMVSPSEGERFYLRVLLNHVRGPESFEELLTVNAIRCHTFKEAAQRRGLLQEDDYNRQCLQEACSFRMPCSLRRLFVSILVFCQPNGVRQLWDEFHQYMMEDFARSNSGNMVYNINKLLLTLRRLLHSYRKKLTDFDLPSISEDFVNKSTVPRIIEDELSVHISAEDLQSVQSLNDHQRTAFEDIMEKISSNQSAIFFLDGPGGSGKTFLVRALLAHLRTSGHIVVAVATSGIAATNFSGGRTAHSRLKIPLKPRPGSFCTIDKQSDIAELIRRATTIVWDEAPMANRYAFEAVDNTFQDIMENNFPFGGKIMILGGDFRQVLPVVKGGSFAQQIASSVSKSLFWRDVKVIRLQQNMRSQQDPEFSQFLLRIGNGQQLSINGDFIELPPSMVIPWEGEHSIYSLIDHVFPHMVDHAYDANYMVGRAIITPRNADVDKINEMLIEIFYGEAIVYTSWDSVDDDNHQLY